MEKLITGSREKKHLRNSEEKLSKKKRHRRASVEA